MDNFEILLKTIILTPGSTILDIGAGGVAGENTSEYLYKLFSDSFQIYANHIGESPSNTWCRDHPKVQQIIADCYIHNFGKKFDLIVQDMPLLFNISDWEDLDHINVQIYNMLNSGGYYINYIMKDKNYGSSKHQHAIAANHKQHWDSDDGLDEEFLSKKILEKYGKKFECIRIIKEGRRELFWVLLKKI